MDWLLVAVIVLPLFDWLVFIALAFAAFFPPRVNALSERAATALALAIAASIFSILAIADQPHSIDQAAVRYLGGVAVVLISLPALTWFALLLRGRFS